jgi:fatty-acyl-CoA synthase
LSVDRSVVSHTPALLKGAPPEINLLRLRQEVESYGPAGCVGADDIEMYDRCQQAFAATEHDVVLLSRGFETDRTDSDGVISGGPTDETALRAFWRHYRGLMS